MTVQERYEAARKMYADVGVDTDAAIAKLKEIPVSLHCWQGDDVTGFDHDGPLTGGIQTTGNYPGKAKTPEQLMQDMEEAMSLMPGKKKLNLHASYAIFEKGEFADRDKLEPKHFRKWVDFAKKHHVGIDFNPTFFSHDQSKRRTDTDKPGRGDKKILDRAWKSMYPHFGIFCKRDRCSMCDEYLDWGWIQRYSGRPHGTTHEI